MEQEDKIKLKNKFKDIKSRMKYTVYQYKNKKNNLNIILKV